MTKLTQLKKRFTHVKEAYDCITDGTIKVSSNRHKQILEVALVFVISSLDEQIQALTPKGTVVVSPVPKKVK